MGRKPKTTGGHAPEILARSNQLWCGSMPMAGALSKF
jgi:hypothetical protein